MVLTFYALYADDFRLACTADPSFDVEFGIIAFVVFLIFVGELALLVRSTENYALSFSFGLARCFRLSSLPTTSLDRISIDLHQIARVWHKAVTPEFGGNSNELGYISRTMDPARLCLQ